MRPKALVALTVAATAVALGWHALRPSDATLERNAAREQPATGTSRLAIAGSSSEATHIAQGATNALGADIDSALASKDYRRLNESVAALLRSSLSDSDKFGLLWRFYWSQRQSDPMAGRILLDSTMALNLRPHLPTLLQEFAGRDTPAWARARALMLIGQQHARGEQEPSSETSQRQEQIRALLARAVNDSNPEVAREATINYARLSSASDGQDVLDRAYRRQLLSKEEFLRESILRLPGLVDSDQQRRVVQDLQAIGTSADAATTRLIAETVALVVQDVSAVRTLDGATRAGLLELLAKSAPNPTSDASQYAMSTAASFYDWAVATGVLQGASEQALGSYLARLASVPSTTAAQLAALLLSPHAPVIAQAAAESGQLTAWDTKLRQALEQTAPSTAAHSVYSAALAAATRR